MKHSFITKIYTNKTIEKIDLKVSRLGPNSKLDTARFLNIRFFIILFSFILTFIYSKYGYVLAPLVAILLHFSLEWLLLELPIKERAKKLEKEGLFFFEIFALTLESGRSLKHALELTCENIDSELSQEFKKTLQEVHLGKSLNEALTSMKKRMPSEAIGNTILNMIEAGSYGVDIEESIQNQIKFLREKQLLTVKGEIAKLPTKVSIISVVFFVPIMLLIILAPLLVDFLSK